MPLKITGRHPPLIDIAIYILIVHTEDIKYFSFLFHCRTGITENNRTRGIRSLHPIPAKLEICTINTFVTDTPKQDRRMITIKMNRLHIRLEYIRIVLAILIIECFPIFIGMMSHPANRRFYFDKHSQFITDIQHFLTRRIM